MRKQVLKNKKIKYDFSNPESQQLFNEFTVLLADITKYVEENKQPLVMPEGKSAKDMRIREMVKTIITKLWNTFCRIIIFIPQKILNSIKTLKNKLYGFLNESSICK